MFQHNFFDQFGTLSIDLVKEVATFPMVGVERFVRIGNVKLVEDDSIEVSSATVLGEFACV